MRFHDERIDKVFATLGILVILLQLGFVGLLCWAIYRLVIHFT